LDSAEAGSFLGQIVDRTSQDHGDHISTDEVVENQRLATESEALRYRSGSDPANRLGQSSVSSESVVKDTVAGTGISATNATADQSARDDSQAGSTQGGRLNPVESAVDGADTVDGTGLTSDRRRSNANRAQSAASMDARRASAFKRHTATNSKSRVFTAPAGFNPHIVFGE